ncbi:ras guanine nucleotide exchange factor domain-containing protein [Catenaria anguillulae PL171]|uniref:Ras guanine nucleotide exchange factor domain-containing protein n=1 Tax=Catenaria anguillulae PL171 TaxID=765915 RepID=A0A1Y2HK38_9FUNG|nr:ras guanine nucleotide exchange factor domain-containing protein [Catenaria anguillulae PL171]
MGKSPPWVMKVRSAEVAQHLSIVDEVILRHVDWTELLDIAVGRHPFATKGGSIFGGSTRNSRAGDQEDEQEKAEDERDTVKAAIDRFNTTCQWVQSQVLIVEDSTLRSKVIEKFIKIAAKCEAYRNYCTLMAIVVALQSINISRLTRTWARISTERKSLLDRLIHLTSPTRNFIELRNAMESAPGVPFAGVYFSDLLFNNEIPSTVNIKSGTSSSATSETDEETRTSTSITRSSHSAAVASRAILDFEGDIVTVVNWQKYKVIAKVVRRFKSFLDSASYDAQYKWALRDDVFWHAVYIDRQVLEADELTRRSYAYEPSQRAGAQGGSSGTATPTASSSAIRSP